MYKEEEEIEVCLMSKWTKAKVLSIDSTEGWIILSTEEFPKFTLNTRLHVNHLRAIKKAPVPKPKKKRGRPPKKKSTK